MKFRTLIAAAAVLLPTLSYAEGDLSRANVIELPLEMGTDKDGNMYFKPNHFDLVTGQAYVLVMTNIDEYKHELSLNEALEKLFIRKVEISTPDGELVAEIKGNIREVEVGPHQTVEWFFVPVQTGENLEISCEIEGHYDAGMFGTFTIR
jgi:uncharacterized cupredoxin-like copper-binding protein